MKTQLRLFAGLLLSMVLLAGCASTTNVPDLSLNPSGPTAFRVGTEIVTVAAVQERLERDIGPAVADLLAQGQTPEQIEQLANESNIRGTVFDRMVQDALLLQYARRHGIGVDATAIDQSALAQVPLDAEAPFISQTEDRIAIARNQLAFEVIARNTRADMFNARHILVRDEATADQVLAELAAGRSFAELAEAYSQDAGSIENGGDLGWTARGDFVPEFENAAFSIELNTPTKVTTQFGVHVIEVLDRAENRAFDTFEQLQRSQNAQVFFEESFVLWYEQLLAEAQASGELQVSPGFDPNTVPLPIPE
ncbi:MAG: peptidylprolyl isomerase [Oscillochloris sp.]|nr:peptidylprolyl isomerase [Oscillochloris sp.]